MGVSSLADTFVNQTAAGRNYGASRSLVSDGHPGRKSYLRFAIPAAPDGKRLTGAVLRLRTTSAAYAGSRSVHVVSVATGKWSAKTVRWGSRPVMTRTRVGRLVGATEQDRDYSISLSATVLRQLHAGKRTFIITSSGRDGLWFSSRNGAKAPRLELTYR